jgi:hypothetical protein
LRFIFDYYDKLSGFHFTQGKQATKLSPKLNVFYTTNNTLQFFVKSGMGFHSNDMRVVIANNGYETLPSSFGGDIGAVIKPVSGLYIQPSLWYLYLQQEFVFNGDDGTWEPSGKTRRLGADISVRYQPLNWLYIDADANYANPRYIPEFTPYFIHYTLAP